MQTRWIVAGIAAWGAVLGGCGRQAVVTSGPTAGGGVGAGDAALVAELERLAARQEVFHAETGRYADTPEALGLTPASGVRLDILEASPGGFAAIATTAGGESECGVYVGGARRPRGYVQAPGEVYCRRR